MKIAMMMLAALVPLCAQEIKLPANLDALAEKAMNAVDVTLDGPILQLAAKFAGKDGENADLKKVIAGLQGIYVRCYEFASEGEYNKSDIDAVRAQLQAPDWLRAVGVRSKKHGDDVDVYFKMAASGVLGGIVIICTEPKELTVVNIVGTIDPAQISLLGGRFHIPGLDMSECRFPRTVSE